MGRQAKLRRRSKFYSALHSSPRSYLCTTTRRQFLVSAFCLIWVLMWNVEFFSSSFHFAFPSPSTNHNSARTPQVFAFQQPQSFFIAPLLKLPSSQASQKAKTLVLTRSACPVLSCPCLLLALRKLRSSESEKHFTSVRVCQYFSEIISL